MKNGDLKPPLIGRKSYESNHRKVCETLSLDEVYAPKVYRSVVRESDSGGVCRIDYTPGNSPMWCHTKDKIPPEQVGKRRYGVLQIDSDNRFERSKRMIYLSHVVTQCGLKERAIKPLLRLLRMGYHMDFTNFKRLVKMVTTMCNDRHDFTRNIGAPIKGTRSTPVLLLESKPLKFKGDSLPPWKLSKKFFGNIRDLHLD